MTTKKKTTAAQDHLAEVLEFLPKEAHDAMRTGGNWDGMPDSGGDCSTWYTYNEGEWDAHTYPTGYVVEAGKLYFRVMMCDSDGNWDFCDEAEVGTPDEARLEAEFSHEEWRKTYDDYLRWVAEHGEDPMNEFMVKAVFPVEQKWRAQCVSSQRGGVALLRARREGGKWLPPAALPPEVTTYLQATEGKNEWVMGDFERLADLKKLVAESADLKQHGEIFAERAPLGIIVGFTVKVSTPNPNYRAELIKAAKQGLKPVGRTK